MVIRLFIVWLVVGERSRREAGEKQERSRRKAGSLHLNS
jgi:hypothetical protein